MKQKIEILQKGVLSNDRVSLSRAITLVESQKASDREAAFELINSILPNTGKSFRIGITGAPGIGKSSFINTFGNHLITLGKKVAVLAVDPSSEISGGSILGDKTRMDLLVGNKNAFVRPSPNSGELGGINRNTYESMLLCEANGYDVILIETVGIGQSEISVKEIVDFVILLTIPGTGDELQGIKRGIMETVDLVVINKIDLFEKKRVMELKQSLTHALHLFPEKLSKHPTKVLTVSALEALSIYEVWVATELYFSIVMESGYYTEKRKLQRVSWMKRTLYNFFITNLFQNEKFKTAFDKYETAVLENEISPYEAALTIYNQALNT